MVKQILVISLLSVGLASACGASDSPGAPEPITESVAVAVVEEVVSAGISVAVSEGSSTSYLESIRIRKEEMVDTAAYKKEGPYRIALAAQGPTNAWAALFDEHIRNHVDELGKEVVAELLYADANGSAEIQVPQIDELLSQKPDALILVPMGGTELSEPTERAMAQGVPVILCASGVATNVFATEVGTNLFESGASLAQFLVDELDGKGNVIQMNGSQGVDTAEIMAQGAESVWAANPGIKVLKAESGNWSTEEAKTLMAEWIAQYGQAIQGIWSGGAQMSEGIVAAYLEAGLAIPPIGGGEYANSFLRLAKEEKINFSAWEYPNAMSIVCLDTAIKILRGEAVPRFVDFKDELPRANNFGVAQLDEYYNPSWRDDVSGPIFLSDEKMKELGYSE